MSRFPAVDGEKLNVDVLANQGLVTRDILSKDYFSVGALGCAVSNLTLWDRAVASGQVVTISEDDAIFNYEFESHAEALIKNLPADWDVVFWGFNFDMFVCFDMLPGVTPCVATFDQDQMRLGTSAFQKLKIAPQLFKAVWVFGTACYSISAKGADTLKTKILPLKPQVVSLPEAKRVPPFSASWRTVGIDNCINAVQRDIKSYVCFPPLVVTKNERETSTVRSS